MSTSPSASAKAAAFVERASRSDPLARPRALVQAGDGSTVYDSGDSTLPVAISGITKLFTLAMVLREVDRGALALETPLGELLPADTVRGLCVVKGTDHSFSVTIEQLLRHTSGIVDYMRPGKPGMRSFVDQFLEHDRGWSLDQALEIAKHYPGQAVPGKTSRTMFSSTNFLLLGAILQETTGMRFDELIRLRVVSSLGLGATYVYGPDHYEKYFTLSPVHVGTQVVRIPQALASSSADGAIVSTPKDTLAFLRAFWRGDLFAREWIPRLTEGTIPSTASERMGLGVMVSPRKLSRPLVVGHSGVAGGAVGVNPEDGTIAFFSTSQWSPLGEGFSSVAKLVRVSSG